jgi:hypothetical protein
MSFIKRNPHIAFRIFGKEAIIYSSLENKIHCLNEIGTKVGEVSVGGGSVENILTCICNEYDIKREKAEPDILNLIKKMKKAKLLLTK